MSRSSQKLGITTIIADEKESPQAFIYNALRTLHLMSGEENTYVDPEPSICYEKRIRAGDEHTQDLFQYLFLVLHTGINGIIAELNKNRTDNLIQSFSNRKASNKELFFPYHVVLHEDTISLRRVKESQVKIYILPVGGISTPGHYPCGSHRSIIRDIAIFANKIFQNLELSILYSYRDRASALRSMGTVVSKIAIDKKALFTYLRPLLKPYLSEYPIDWDRDLRSISIFSKSKKREKKIHELVCLTVMNENIKEVFNICKKELLFPLASHQELYGIFSQLNHLNSWPPGLHSLVANYVNSQDSTLVDDSPVFRVEP